MFGKIAKFNKDLLGNVVTRLASCHNYLRCGNNAQSGLYEKGLCNKQGVLRTIVVRSLLVLNSFILSKDY